LQSHEVYTSEFTAYFAEICVRASVNFVRCWSVCYRFYRRL